MNDTPEDPQGGDEGPVGAGGGGDPDESDAPQRGWIDPDDRLWRHPSEVAGRSGGTPVLLSAPPRRAARNVAMILIGVAAVMAVAAWAVVLLSPASQRPERATGVVTTDAQGAPLTTLAGADSSVPAAAQVTGRSVIALQVPSAHGPVSLVGVAVAEGGLVATTADLLRGVRQVSVIGPDGHREVAPVIGFDSTSDIALVDVPEDLPVPRFVDDAGLAAGAADLRLALVPSGSTMALQCTPGSVTSVGQAIVSGPAGGMASITSSSSGAPYAGASPARSPAITGGEPLLTTTGAVIGILYDPAPGSATATTFLPSGLVVGVADELRSHQRVLHGWLGISGADAPAGGGAEVASVDPNGPAAGHVAAGQVVVGVDSLPVRTMAELRARLYVLDPGDPVALSLEQPTGAKVVTDVILAGSS